MRNEQSKSLYKFKASRNFPTPHSKLPSGEPPLQLYAWNNPNKNPMIKATHNCYTYMLNDLYNKPRIHDKPQPGAYANMNRLFNSNERLNCRQVTKGVLADNPSLSSINLEEGLRKRCRPGYYKGFMMVSPGNDYHFARQDNRMIGVYRKMLSKNVTKPSSNQYYKYAKEVMPNIVKLAQILYPNSNSCNSRLKAIFKTAHTWSHKPGASNATDKDADGNIIINPLLANWNYSKSGGINYSKMCCFFEIPSNYTTQTYSTGYSFGNTKNKNNVRNIVPRKEISKRVVDNKYEINLLGLINASS